MNSHIVFGENNLTAMNKTRKSIFEISAVFIISFVAMFLTMDRTVNIYDEGIILTAAMRVAAGDIIHRDFYANYGPAEFYVVSWLLKAFGHSILPERIFDLSMRAGIATLIYSSLVYYCGRSMAFAATSVCVIWLCTVGNHGYPIYPALLLSLGSTLIMTKAFARNISILYPFVAGTLTGLGALFRYDIGFFAFIANTLAALLILASTRTQIEQISKGALKKITAYAFGAGLPVAVVLFFYFSQSALNSFFHDVVAFPSQYYARTRGLPFPSVSSLFDGLGFILLAIYIPIIIGGMVAIGFFGKQVAGLVSTGDGERAKSFFNEKSVLAIFLTFLVAMFYLKGIVRVSIEHMQLSLLPSIMLLAVLAGIIKKNKILFAAALSVVALSCLATALLSGYKKLAHNHNLVANDLKGFIKASKASGNAQRANSSKASIDPKSMAPFYVEGDRANAVRFIQENTAPGERIYVGLTTHDKVFVNDVSAYFMANRLPITKWHHFDPGLQSSEKIQSEIIDDLEKAKPNYIWLESTWNGVNEPNDSALSSGIKMLDGYILQHYLPAQTFGQIVILRRRG